MSITPMNESGWCMWVAEDGKSHLYCTKDDCPCDCHTKEKR